ISITDPPYSAAIDDTTDDSAAWQRAFDDLGANGGGRLLFNKPGTSRVLKTVTIPRVDNITFEGLGRNVCVINGVGFPGAPVFEWDNTSNQHVEYCLWQNMTIRHTQSGRVIRHQNADANVQRFKDCVFRNLGLVQGSNGTEVTLDVEGILHSRFEDIHLIGGNNGGTGFRVRGSHVFLENIYAPTKSSAPSMFLDFQSSNSRIAHVRTEGGNSSIADYWIHDCVTVDIQDLHSEGVTSPSIVRIENCNGVLLASVGIAIQDECVMEPVGIRFINSKYCIMIGGHVGARQGSDGYAILFDENSNHNTLSAVRIIRTDSQGQPNQILDQGVGNRWSIVEKSGLGTGTSFIMPY
ncbi:MAG TPA: hypothetical protein VJ044_09745, partial [Candidatus Hodarchaeales archaeon]|nr:hypothetical protein [Candidatus Hodarchaeales archaeon]